MMTFQIAIYPEPHRLKDGRLVPGFRPEMRAVSFEGLVGLLTRFRVVSELEHKLHLPAWAPHSLARPHRRLSNVASVSCLVYDYDDGTPIEEAHRAFADWPHLLHTSWSHAPDHPKFRVVVPLEEPIPAEHYPAAWRWGALRSGRSVDRACKDASRLYFLPATPSKDAPRYASYRETGSRLLDLRPWDRLPPDPQEIAAEQRREEARRRWEGRRVPAARREAAAAAILREDPEARARAADLLGARVVVRQGGRIAVDVTCPSCGDRSAWFPIDVVRMASAACNHRNSCGWAGPLIELLQGRGVAA